MLRIRIFSNIAIHITIVSCSMALASCTKNYTEINTDRNTIATVGAAELPFLFAKAESSAIPNIWNYQIAQNLFADQYAQYFACNATYFPSDRLFIRQDWVGAAFNPIYTDVVPQLQSIKQAADPASPEAALADVVWVLAFHRVTDYWGPIPYFNAGQPGNSVAYDPQDKIYDDFFKKLSGAAAILKSNLDKKPYGDYDLIYGGDINKWLKFANTLRLRLALRISQVDPERAKTEAEAAYADGVLTDSPGDDALLQKSETGQDYNGLSVMSDWDEFRMSASMESVLKGYTDPRMPVYFLPAQSTGTYEGLRNGLTSTQLTEDINKAKANSHAGPRWASPQYGGLASYEATPQNVMATAEAYFLRAEGALMGWNMGGTPKDLYEQGITNSLKQWGIADAAVIQGYINSDKTPIAPNDFLHSPPLTNLPVKFSSDPTIQKAQVALQKWLAMYPDGAEAWADNRRNPIWHSDVLKLYPVANSDNPDIPDPTKQWIRRIPFLTSERQNNGAEVTKAEQLLNGPDNVTTKLWWDKN